MTEAVPVRARLTGREDDELLRRAQRSLDVAALIGRGWDPDLRLFAPSPDDPLFGWAPCERLGCHRGARHPASRRVGLCESCLANYRDTYDGKLTIEEYKQVRYRQSHRLVEQELCLVCRQPGHRRRARNDGLCAACDKARLSKGLTVEAFVAGDEHRPRPRPRPSLPDCEVAGCGGEAEYRKAGLCAACYKRWLHHGKPEPDQFKAAGLPSTTFDGRRAELSGLPALVEAQILLGIQRVIKLELQTSADSLQRIARKLRDQRVQDLRLLDRSWNAGRNGAERWVFRVLREAAIDAATDIEEEFERDVWLLRILYPATRHREAVMSFAEIAQLWLRELTKAWCRRRAPSVAEATLRGQATCTRSLSAFLSTLPDGGERPELLTRGHLDRFIQWEHASQTPQNAARMLGHLRELLRFARRHGHTARGGIAAGLPEEFSLLDEDVRSLRQVRKRESADYEPGRAIPDYVLRQLLEPKTLELLANEDVRAIFQLLAHTGRRPIEICDLDADCLVWAERDAAGVRRPLLRYKREKPPKKRLTLPITEEAADLICRQQQVVLARYRGRALADLKLFPTPIQNASGRRGVRPSSMAISLRRWANGLALVASDGSPFRSEDVYPYALRHAYAQRHADAGVQLDVLQELMDHRSPQTTQGYYRVRAERLHEAIRLTAPLMVNRDGSPVGSGSYPDAERIVRDVGRIPVPLGHCTEPHNVKALGSACPFSHQCLGCVHYRTDPSYLPDLYAYLEQLLDARERLHSAVPQLREWARAKAVPNDAEIRAVRNLIRANEHVLSELEDNERRKLEELLAVLRATRARAEDRLPVHQVGAIAQPEPRFAPPAVTTTPTRAEDAA
ncbi:MAG TPA: site-specific integrase [Solirubrobacteraceae bacterium]|nr:site-specific integrase [Solirubrobacteraceae bacterium]